jgi:hypothetical protein
MLQDERRRVETTHDTSEIACLIGSVSISQSHAADLPDEKIHEIAALKGIAG